jgi:hypothetical protein
MINAALPARPSTENWVPVDTTTPGGGVSEHAVHKVITVAHTKGHWPTDRCFMPAS